MGLLFSKNSDTITDVDSTPAMKTPKNKFFKKINIDPRSPTFGGYDRTPIRVAVNNQVSTNTPSTPMN